MKTVGVRGLGLLCAVLLSACQTLPVTNSEETAAAVEPAATTDASCECPTPEAVALVCPSEPEPAPVTSQPCQPPRAAPAAVKATQGLLIIGRVEYALIKREGSANAPLKLKARIDTGAGMTSMHAHELVEFERDGDPWVRFGLLKPKTEKPVFFERPVKDYANIKQLAGEPQRRPIVRMTLTIGDIEESVEVTLTDRSDYVYQVLIGRNLLRDRAMVDVRRKFIADDGFYQQ